MLTDEISRSSYIIFNIVLTFFTLCGKIHIYHHLEYIVAGHTYNLS